ncbi:MAG: succinate dehydrogenase cytochrome b subunit [Deltaproteobacteria bacterium]|nr:succinate dehydrogenase cytochrome b subunit [Deltaproteobacteria bacterium]
MRFLSSSVGRKVLMAITGFFMLFFVTVHLLGNSSIFIGPGALNTYAEKLHSLGPLVWIFRGFMFLMLAVHVFFGIMLTLENSAANPSKYAIGRKLKATFASETMIWTGVLLLSFLVYHLLQFTVRVTPDIMPDAVANRPGDVYKMVLGSFRITTISLVYVAAMATLFLHLSHGIQSLFQTVGCSNDKTLPKVTMVGKLVSALFLVGYSAIPVLILAGILKN